MIILIDGQRLPAVFKKHWTSRCTTFIPITVLSQSFLFLLASQRTSFQFQWSGMRSLAQHSCAQATTLTPWATSNTSTDIIDVKLTDILMFVCWFVVTLALPPVGGEGLVLLVLEFCEFSGGRLYHCKVLYLYRSLDTGCSEIRLYTRQNLAPIYFSAVCLCGLRCSHVRCDFVVLHFHDTSFPVLH